MSLLKLKPKLKTILFKKAIEIPSTRRPSFTVPIPYLDTFARDLARGKLEHPLQNLQRILVDLGLGPHSLLGVNFVTRNPAEDLVTAKISNVFEPVVAILGPPEFAGKPTVTLINELKAGKLRPESVKGVLVQFDRNMLSSTGAFARPTGTFRSTGLPASPEEVLEAFLSLSRRQIPLIETVPLIDPNVDPGIRFTERQLQELFDRYHLLQQLRASMGLPPARQLGPEHWYPLEKVFHILESFLRP